MNCQAKSRPRVVGTRAAVPFRILTGIFVLVLLLVLVLGPTASITSTSTISLGTRTTEPTHRSVGGSSILESRDHLFALVVEDLEGFVEDRSQLREDRAATNATTLMMLDFRFWNTHSVHFPIDVLPTQRERFRGRSKPSVATQAQDHFPNWVGLLHQLVDDFPRDELVDFDGASLRSNLGKRILVDDLPIDGIVHELPRELDPFVDRRSGHHSGFELLVKLLRMPRGDLIDLDPRWHEFFVVRYHLFPYRDGGWLA